MSIVRPRARVFVGLLITAIACCGWAEDGKSENSLLGKLIEIREREGKDNAVIYYLRAEELVPEEYTDYPHTLLRKIRLDGWSEEGEALLPYFEQWKPALDEIRRGTRVGYARNASYRVPYFVAGTSHLQHLIAAIMLAAEGRYLESRGEYEKALDNYLTGVKLGRDFTQPEGSYFHHRTGIGIAGISIRPLYDLVQTGRLNERDLRKVIAELKQVEETWGPIADAFALDESLTRKLLEESLRLNEDSEEDSKEDKYLVPFRDAIKDPDSFTAEIRRLQDFESRYAKAQYWEMDPDRYRRERETLLSTCCQYIQETCPSSPGIEIMTSQTRVLSQFRATRLAAAVGLYRLNHDAAPRSLNQLVPDYLDALPADPFTGKPLRYRPWSDEGGGAIYSLGPDREDDRMEIEYDATNGTVSEGDVFLR